MGRYYNPVSDVTYSVVGRALSGRDYYQAKRQLRSDEHLYALCDRFIFKQVVCVDEKSEFDEFFRQYSDGTLVSFELYALDESAHAAAQ